MTKATKGSALTAIASAASATSNAPNFGFGGATGVRHQLVEAAEALACSSDQCGGEAFLRQVAELERDLGACRFRGRGGLLESVAVAAGGQQQGRIGCGDAACGGRADAAGRTGDQNDAFDPLSHARSSCASGSLGGSGRNELEAVLAVQI